MYNKMKSVLTPQEYILWCSLTDKARAARLSEMQPSYILEYSFNWHDTEQGYDYWDVIWARLVRQEVMAILEQCVSLTA